MTITGPRKKDPSYTLRRVFVHSSANADAAARARARKLEQAAGELDRLTRGLGSRHYPDAAKVTARVSAIAAARRVGDYLRADAGTGPDGRPTLDWHFDQAAIDAEAATDGWYALLTNLDPATSPQPRSWPATRTSPPPASAATTTSKGRSPSRRCSCTPTGGSPPSSASSAWPCSSTALSNARPGATSRPPLRLDGLYAGRPAKPTASLIFTTLATLRLRAGTSDRPPQIPQPDPRPAATARPARNRPQKARRLT